MAFTLRMNLGAFYSPKNLICRKMCFIQQSDNSAQKNGCSNAETGPKPIGSLLYEYAEPYRGYCVTNSNTEENCRSSKS